MIKTIALYGFMEVDQFKNNLIDCRSVFTINKIGDIIKNELYFSCRSVAA